MTIEGELPCPSCGRTLGDLSWHDSEGGTCRSCLKDFEFMGFPELGVKRPGATPKAVVLPEHATCFHHPENQAEVVCEGCGRFLCSVCAVNFGGRMICASCIKAGLETDTRSIKSRVLFDGIALSVALFPIIFWPATLVSAPVALGTAIYGWRQPPSLVSPGRAKLVFAALLALAQIAGWVALFMWLWLRKKH